MIILTGYYHFGAQRDTTSALQSARDEANSWNAKVYLNERTLALHGADGVLSDKFGFWYILHFTLAKDRVSFTTTNETSGEKHLFELVKKKKDHEFFGEVSALHYKKGGKKCASCLVLTVPEIVPSLSGIPERMLELPPSGRLH